jgi:AcrR family transcriptional regulator
MNYISSFLAPVIGAFHLPRAKAPAPETSPVRPAHQRRSREKRDLLVKAGIRVFARDGFEGATVADIAQDAGISVGVFYQRFKDKRGFFEEVENHFVKRGKENWNRFCNDANPDWTARELLEQMVSNLGRVISTNEGFFRALVTLGHKDKSVLPPAISMDRHGASRMADLMLVRGFLDHRTIDREQVYFAIYCVSRILVLMTLSRANIGYHPTDERTIEELALMVARYLQIEV